MIDISKVYLRVKPTMWRWEDDGERQYIIFVNRRKELVLLNPVASLIFASCNTKTKLEDILKTLSEKYPTVSMERLEKDTKEFITHMLKTGIMEICNYGG